MTDNNNKRVQILNKQGTFVAIIGKGVLQYPYAVSCSDSHQRHNHIVAVDLPNQIYLFYPASSSSSSDYKLLRSFCSHGSEQQQTNHVYSICFDDERNRIIVCDNYNNKRLSVWSADGSQFIQTINMTSSSTHHNPMSVCVDRYANCHRLLVGTEQLQILVLDVRNNNYKVLQIIGSKGEQLGQFSNYIEGVYVNGLDSSLLATDTDNHRIQIF